MASTKRTTAPKDDEPTDDAETVAPKEAEAPSEEAPKQASDDEPTGPRPWRVEPYSDGETWGWRLCAADGTIVHESGLDYDTSAAAVDEARDDDRTEGSTFPAQR